MSNNRKYFSCTTFTEVKTASGQLLNIQCRPEDKEKIKELFGIIYKLSYPVTKEIKNISHGGYGRYTRFDIKQNKYAGGGCGYIEVIEIKNAPEDRNGNIVHECESSNSTYWEFDTIENAIEGWEHSWGINCPGDILKKSKGFIREVKCGWFSPWFYAVADQALYGDFAFPERIGTDHYLYRPFNRFIVKKYDPSNEEADENGEIEIIKTCIGYTCREERYDYYNSDKTYLNHTIYWDDGTLWSGSSLSGAPQLIEKDKYVIIQKKKLCDFAKKKEYYVK